MTLCLNRKYQKFANRKNKGPQIPAWRLVALYYEQLLSVSGLEMIQTEQAD